MNDASERRALLLHLGAALQTLPANGSADSGRTLARAYGDFDALLVGHEAAGW